MPQLDQFTYFTQFFWSCLFFFAFYILICNDRDGILGISRILKLRNKLLSHRGNKIQSKDPKSLEDILRKGFNTGVSYMYSTLFEVSQWCKAADLFGKRKKRTWIMPQLDQYTISKLSNSILRFCILLFILFFFYLLFLFLGLDFNLCLKKVQSILFVKSLHFLLSSLGWSGGSFLIFLLSFFFNDMLGPLEGSQVRPSDPLSPLPSISSRGDSWISETYEDKNETSSSAAQAVPHEALPQPSAQEALPQEFVVPSPNSIKSVDQDSIWDELDQSGQAGSSVGAEDDARLSKAVEGIMDACYAEEQKIVQKTRSLLERRGVVLQDPKDIQRAVDIEMTEEWDVDIDSLLPHFRRLHRFLGTRNCTLYPAILKRLRDLGNPDVPEQSD